jgi:hypothetical protein
MEDLSSASGSASAALLDSQRDADGGNEFISCATTSEQSVNEVEVGGGCQTTVPEPVVVRVEEDSESERGDGPIKWETVDFSPAVAKDAESAENARGDKGRGSASEDTLLVKNEERGEGSDSIEREADFAPTNDVSESMVVGTDLPVAVVGAPMHCGPDLNTKEGGVVPADDAKPIGSSLHVEGMSEGHSGTVCEASRPVSSTSEEGIDKISPSTTHECSRAVDPSQEQGTGKENWSTVHEGSGQECDHGTDTTVEMKPGHNNCSFSERMALPIISVAPPTPVAETAGDKVGVAAGNTTTPSIYLSDGTEKREEEITKPKVPKRMTMVSSL